MNERILELIKQATEYDYTTWDSYNQKEVVHYKFNQQKFAQLIVKDCMRLNCQELSVTAIERLLPLYKEHFGVEE